MNRGRPFGVSLCMIVRDEEAYIEECLRSAMPYVSEIIVCDTGSQDRTCEIAERLGARVERMEWNDHFAEARNHSLSFASEPWILILDADERLEPAADEEWHRLLTDERHAGYCIRLVSPLARNGDERDDTAVTDAVCRLFRNDPRIRFEGVIHEACASAVAAAQGSPPAIAALTIRHEGYRANVIEQRRKPERNLRLLAKALEREPDNDELRYAAGTELLGAGRWTDAIGWLMPLTEQLEGKYGLASDIRLKLSHALRMAGRLEEAAEQALAGIRSYPDFPDLYEVLAAARMAQDDAEDALAAYRQAIVLGEAAPHYSSVEGAGSYRSMCGAGAACERLYRWHEAALYYLQALETHPVLELAWERLLMLLQAGLPIEPTLAAAVEMLAEAAETETPPSQSKLLRVTELLHQHSGPFTAQLGSALSRMVIVAGGGVPRRGQEGGQCGQMADGGESSAHSARHKNMLQQSQPLSKLAFSVQLRVTATGARSSAPLPMPGGKPYERELAEALLAAASCRWAAACDNFAAAHAAACGPAQARAAAAGLAAAFAARAEEHIAAIDGVRASTEARLSGAAGNSTGTEGDRVARLQASGASADIGNHSLRCRSELMLIGLTALYPSSS